MYGHLFEFAASFFTTAQPHVRAHRRERASLACSTLVASLLGRGSSATLGPCMPRYAKPRLGDYFDVPLQPDGFTEPLTPPAMNVRFVFVTLLLVASAALAQSPSLNCNIGPANRTFGGSDWFVYGCDDRHSVVVITAPGSPASPFYFMFAHKDGAYRLIGEGTGNKAATQAAYQELSILKPEDIAGLFAEASRTAKK